MESNAEWMDSKRFNRISYEISKEFFLFLFWIFLFCPFIHFPNNAHIEQYFSIRIFSFLSTAIFLSKKKLKTFFLFCLCFSFTFLYVFCSVLFSIRFIQEAIVFNWNGKLCERDYSVPYYVQIRSLHTFTIVNFHRPTIRFLFFLFSSHFYMLSLIIRISWVPFCDHLVIDCNQFIFIEISSKTFIWVFKKLRKLCNFFSLLIVESKLRWKLKRNGRISIKKRSEYVFIRLFIIIIVIIIRRTFLERNANQKLRRNKMKKAMYLGEKHKEQLRHFHFLVHNFTTKQNKNGQNNLI